MRRDRPHKRVHFGVRQAARAGSTAATSNALVKAVDVDAEPQVVHTFRRDPNRFPSHRFHAPRPHFFGRHNRKARARRVLGQLEGVGKGPDADLYQVITTNATIQLLQDAAKRRAAAGLTLVASQVIMRIHNNDADAARNGVRKRLDMGKRESMIATKQHHGLCVLQEVAGGSAHRFVRRKHIGAMPVERGHIPGIMQPNACHIASRVRVKIGQKPHRLPDARGPELCALPAEDTHIVRHACHQHIRFASVGAKQFQKPRIFRSLSARRHKSRTSLEHEPRTDRGLEALATAAPRVDADLYLHGNLATMQGTAGARDATAASDVALREQWGVAIQAGRITWVGPHGEWDGQAARTIDATGQLVTPGYVDPHNHLVYAGDRAFELSLKLQGKSYLEILAAGGGINYTVERTRKASLEQLVREARPRLDRMIQNGTTTLEAKSGYGLTTESELRLLEANQALAASAGVPIISTFLGAHAVPSGTDAAAFADLVIDEMLPQVAAQGIARYCDVFVEENVFTIEQGDAIFSAAKRHGLGLRLHADEIVNTGGAQLAARAGCVSADHLLRVSDEGIEAMAEAGTIATLLPTVPLTLMRPEWAPGKRFLDAGVPVALATDHNPNNPVTNMTLVAQLGCFLLGLSPAQALTAATWNAACTLGMEHEVGSIEVGKRADLLVHNIADLDHWVYEPGRQTAQAILSHGRVHEMI